MQSVQGVHTVSMNEATVTATATALRYDNDEALAVLRDPTLPQRDGAMLRHAHSLLDRGLLEWQAPRVYTRTVNGDRVLAAV